MQEKQSCLLAIEGRAAAGKTTLAYGLEKYFDGAIIHMDDFFLPPVLRTQSRYTTPGGNIHYERFNEEVGKPLGNGQDFEYQRFNCKKMQLESWQQVPNKKVIIVEGVYATHPKIKLSYDLKFFLDISKEEQVRRLLYRNGEEGLEVFLKKWIPLEEKYFEHYRVMEACECMHI